MGEIFNVPKKSKIQHREHLKNKKCKFPGCNQIFAGTGKSCYCLTHRHRKYRKIIDEHKNKNSKIEKESSNVNQIINHHFTEVTKMFLKCKLDGCYKEFEVIVYPNIFIYPKYCLVHRNEFKRKMWKNGKEE
jgi:hypothetical protein